MISLAAGVTTFEALACLGLGAAFLRMLRLSTQLGQLERLACAFSLGVGLLGWILFFFGLAGWFTPSAIVSVLAIGSLGNIFLRPVRVVLPRPRSYDWLVIAGFVAAALFDLAEALSPPADADTLAYHYALPKAFVEAGRLLYAARAVDGAIPLLVQTTYVPALMLGGEMALQLWTMISGWAGASILYVLLRRHIAARWASALALAYLTTPAVLFAGGNGQVETRMVGFALVALTALADMLRTRDLRYAVLAGTATGFLIGSKFLGALFASVAGIATLAGGRRLSQAALFAVSTCIAGFQWYLWNWVNTGDPLFPYLIGTFGIGDTSLWTSAQHAWFNIGLVGGEPVLPKTLFGLLAFPVIDTFWSHPVMASERTGFGPLIAILFPFAILSAWTFRGKVPTSDLLLYAAVVLACYALWYFSDIPHRVRHMLPVYPILIAVVATAAIRFLEARRMTWVALTALAATILIQLGGHAVFGANYIRHVLSGEDRESFLVRNVTAYEAVSWINRNLRREDKVFTLDRQLIYLFDVPVHYGHDVHDAAINLHGGRDDPSGLGAQLKAQKVTHLLVLEPDTAAATDTSFSVSPPWDKLAAQGCFDLVRRFEVRAFSSRTLDVRAPAAQSYVLLHLRPTCRKQL